jgi:N-acetylneuraminic acid mutarotase
MKRSTHCVWATVVLGLALEGCATGMGSSGAAQPVNVAPAAGEGSSAVLVATGEREQADAPRLRSQPAFLMPVGLTTLGATTLGHAVYVLGGYSGNPHEYSQRDQSRDFSRYDLTTGRWEKLAGVGPLQSAVLVNDGHYVYRVGGMLAKNSPDQSEDLHSLADVGRFDPETGKWQVLESLPSGRSSHQAVIAGSTLYVLGGWTIEGTSADHEWQDALLSCDLSQPRCSWQSQPMPFRVRAMGVGVHQNELYVLGGLTPDGSTDAVHVYDLTTRTWTDGPAFPTDNMTVAATEMGGWLYANGADGNIYRLSADGKSWQNVGALAFPRMFHQLVASEDSLFALGGIPSTSRGARVRHVERVSPEPRAASAAWTLASLSTAKNRQGAFLVGQQLYVFGGNNSLEQHDFEPDNFVDSAFRLDLGSLEWKKVASFPARRQSVQTVVAGTEDKPLGLAVGGFGYQGDKLSAQAEIQSYDFDADRWSSFSPALPEPRSQFGTAYYQNSLWVFGGLDFDSTRKDSEFKHPSEVLRLDLDHPEKGFASAGLSVREPRRAFAGARLGKRYYMTGGLKEEFGSVTSCEVVDLEQRTAGTMACPAGHRLGGNLVPLAGKLYLVGGSVQNAEGRREPTSRIEVYVPESDSWSTLTETLPLDSLKQLQAFAFRDRLLLYSANRETQSVQVALLDPAAPPANLARVTSVDVPPP